MSCYLDDRRCAREPQVKQQEDEILTKLLQTYQQQQPQQQHLSSSSTPATLPPGYSTEEFSSNSSMDTAREIAELFSQSYKTYPYPIGDPNYLLSSAAPIEFNSSNNTDNKVESRSTSSTVLYRVVRDHNNSSGGKIVAVAAAEVDLVERNAETTDFATHDSARGKTDVRWMNNDLTRRVFLNSQAKASHCICSKPLRRCLSLHDSEAER